MLPKFAQWTHVGPERALARAARAAATAGIRGHTCLSAQIVSTPDSRGTRRGRTKQFDVSSECPRHLRRSGRVTMVPRKRRHFRPLSLPRRLAFFPFRRCLAQRDASRGAAKGTADRLFIRFLTSLTMASVWAHRRRHVEWRQGAFACSLFSLSPRCRMLWLFLMIMGAQETRRWSLACRTAATSCRRTRSSVEGTA